MKLGVNFYVNTQLYFYKLLTFTKNIFREDLFFISIFLPVHGSDELFTRPVEIQNRN